MTPLWRENEGSVSLQQQVTRIFLKVENSQDILSVRRMQAKSTNCMDKALLRASRFSNEKFMQLQHRPQTIARSKRGDGARIIAYGAVVVAVLDLLCGDLLGALR